MKRTIYIIGALVLAVSLAAIVYFAFRLAEARQGVASIAATPTAAIVDISPEAAYYLGMYDACQLFGRAHFQDQLPNDAIEQQIADTCAEFAHQAEENDLYHLRQ